MTEYLADAMSNGEACRVKANAEFWGKQWNEKVKLTPPNIYYLSLKPNPQV